MRLTTDYLVIGAGASGMAFTDALVAESDAEVVLVDRQDRPGGHWLHAYPFVRLHSPSAFYGVSSLPLGADRIDESGPNAGLYERATKTEILDHYAAAAAALGATGRVRLLLGHEHVGTEDGVEELRDVRSGEVHEVVVRRRVVDARYLESSVPATHRPSFEVAGDARFLPVGALPDTDGDATTYAVLGSGKTAVDACLRLLENGVDPERIRWVRPRDAWFHDRAVFQPLRLVVRVMEGLAAEAEAGARARDVEDFFERLEEGGQMVRLDRGTLTTMYRGGMLSELEATRLREVDDVVRLGRVRRIERDRTVLDRGEIPTGPGVLHVDCTARGLRDAPQVPVFGPGRIVLQQVRHNSPSFNAALIGFVEAHRDDDEQKNRLCPPNPYAASAAQYPAVLARTWRTEGRWLREPDVAAWVGASRLNLLQALPAHQHEPAAQAAVTRYLTHVGDAIDRLPELARVR
ncbi:MAG TPA: NAD(P)-binding protein [Nocardioides sp.]|nr:NAD(P)-binding protein [Nocardioides sp.]